MFIDYQYEHPKGGIQTATTDSIADALNVCKGAKNYRIFISIEDIPAALKELRKYQEMTLEAVADALNASIPDGKGYTRQAIYSIEKGIKPVGLKVIRTLLDIYEVELSFSISEKKGT